MTPGDRLRYGRKGAGERQGETILDKASARRLIVVWNITRVVLQTCAFHGSPDADGGFRGSLADQTLWLISLRWVAVSLVVIGTLMGTYLFPMLMDPRPLYAAAMVLPFAMTAPVPL